MLADAHRQAAEDIEATMSKVQTEPSARLVPWLDGETDALVRDIIGVLAARHPDLLAVILYGSVARREERALAELDPSDVDVLAVFDADDEQVGITQDCTQFRNTEQAP